MMKELQIKTSEYISEAIGHLSIPSGVKWLKLEWVSLKSLRAEMIKQYHRSDGDKHKFIKEFFELSDEDIINGSERKEFLRAKLNKEGHI